MSCVIYAGGYKMERYKASISTPAEVDLQEPQPAFFGNYLSRMKAGFMTLGNYPDMPCTVCSVYGNIPLKKPLEGFGGGVTVRIDA